jgi:hypothetical protein
MRKMLKNNQHKEQRFLQLLIQTISLTILKIKLILILLRRLPLWGDAAVLVPPPIREIREHQRGAAGHESEGRVRRRDERTTCPRSTAHERLPVTEGEA